MKKCNFLTSGNIWETGIENSDCEKLLATKISSQLKFTEHHPRSTKTRGKNYF